MELRLEEKKKRKCEPNEYN